MKLYRVTAELFINAPWKDQLGAAVADYLRRSKEEATEQEIWTFLDAAMSENPERNPGLSLMLVVAVSDDDTYLLGYALFRDIKGMPSVGRILQIWQHYAWPGRARMRDLFHTIEPFLASLKSDGFTRVQIYTRRHLPAYAKLLQQIGFAPDGMTYQRIL